MKQIVRFPIGKYFGEKPEDINDMNYLIWWYLNKNDKYPLSSEIIELIEIEIEDRKFKNSRTNSNGWADCSTLEILIYGC